MVRAGAATMLEDVFCCHPELYERSRSWQQITDPVSTSPLIFAEAEPVAEDMLQAGDAAMFVDPFVGDGISLALRSGALAAECLSRFFRRECSLEEARAQYAHRYRRSFGHVFWASRSLRRMLGCPELIRRPALRLLARCPAMSRQLVKMTR
jgi:flavin-dependent dehydrogenase